MIIPRILCTSLIGLLIGVLLVRTFLVLGLVIPVEVAAGSMAPNWFGPHRLAQCTKCGHTFAVGFDPAIATGMATCPRCRNPNVRLNGLPIRAGDRLGIDRTAFYYSVPKRWDVVVFRSPTAANRLCIKRIVGLPGEVVQLQGGDLYVDSAIVRKSLPEQRRVRQNIDRESVGSSRWHPVSQETGWARSAGQWNRNRTMLETDWLVYQPPARRNGDTGIYDTTPYNAGMARRLHPIRDIMVSMRIQLAGKGRLRIGMLDPNGPILCDLWPAELRIELIQNGLQVAATTVQDRGQTWLDRPLEVELSLFDRNGIVAVNGQVLITYPLRETSSPKESGPARFLDINGTPLPIPAGNRLALGADKLSVRILDLEIWRDLYYVWPLGLELPAAHDCWRLGPGEYFVLGDNSPISEDSRTWPGGPGLSRKLLLGKPL